MKPSETLAILVDLKDLQWRLRDVEEEFGMVEEVEILNNVVGLVYESLQEDLGK